MVITIRHRAAMTDDTDIFRDLRTVHADGAGQEKVTPRPHGNA